MMAYSVYAIGRCRCIAEVKCSYRVAGKASALGVGWGSNIPKSAYYGFHPDSLTNGAELLMFEGVWVGQQKLVRSNV